MRNVNVRQIFLVSQEHQFFCGKVDELVDTSGAAGAYV